MINEAYQNNKSHILRDALFSFLQSYLKLEVTKIYEEVLVSEGCRIDLLLTIKAGRREFPLYVEYKRELSHMSRLKSLNKILDQIDGPAMVVASSIDTNIKNKLKRKGIGFLEVEKEGHFPMSMMLDEEYSNKSKKPVNQIKEKGFRAESNIKLLLYFVSRPEALHFTQRELAERLDLSLGAVNYALKNLTAMKLVRKKGKKRFIGDFDDIVYRWKYSVLDTELNRFWMGAFTPLSDSFYQKWKTALKGADSVWGGEPSAAIRTGYLSPEIFTIYTYHNTATPLLKKLRLKKIRDGGVHILKCFWPDELNNDDGTAPDFVTYCNLIDSKIDRNKETALLLKEKILSELKKYEY